jgi:purine-binding chemotaxis protein CheW
MKNKYFVFRKSELNYCIPISSVVEIFQSKSFIDISIKKEGFYGYIEFREELVPVIDINIFLTDEYTKIPDTLYKTVVIIKADQNIYGLIIDKFITTLNLENNDKTKNNNVNNTSNTNLLSYVDFIVNYNKAPLTVLNVYSIGNFVFNNIGKHNTSSLESKSIDKRNKNKDTKSSEELFCFKIGNFKFGVPICQVIEIIEGYSVSPLFRVSEYLRGLINLRGQIIACFDISPSLGIPLRILEENNKYIIFQYQEYEMALCVDSVTKIYNCDPLRIQKVIGILSDEVSEYISGIIEDKEERIFILSIESLFHSKHLREYTEL